MAVWWFVANRPSRPPSRGEELAELQALYDRLVPAPFLDSIERYIEGVMEALDSELSEPMRQALHEIVWQERNFPRPNFEHLDLAQQVELKAKLKKWELRADDGESLARDYLFVLFGSLATKLPKVAAPSPFTIPLAFAIADLKDLVGSVIAAAFDERFRARDIFENLRDQFFLNVCQASGVDPDNLGNKKLKFPRDSDLPPEELVRTYFRRTPLLDLFLVPVPLRLTHHERFSHMHLLAGSGHGKTTIIENLIRHDIASPDPPSIVLIDPHSDLVRKLVSSDLGIDERLVLLDPRDTKHPLAINPFAINRERFATYDEQTREQVTAGVIQTLTYLWNGLTNLTLTGKQDVFARYVIRLLLMMPEVRGENATILDMLRLMSDPSQYQDVIERLPDIPREFFKTDFQMKTFDGTKEQVRYRIQAIIENPTLARLFTSPETKVDFHRELNRGAVILVDSAKDFLKDGSTVFTKLIISLILQAVYERAAIAEQDRKPTFIFIDEAASAFSQNVDDLLSEARKYKAGLVLSHQYLDQATGSLRSSLAANTGIKFAGGLSAGDARSLAPEMRTSADYILEQPKLQFAAYIRNVTPTAVAVPVSPVGSHPQLSDDAYASLLTQNRARVSLPLPAQRAAAPPTPQNEDLSSSW